MLSTHAKKGPLLRFAKKIKPISARTCNEPELPVTEAELLPPLLAGSSGPPSVHAGSLACLFQVSNCLKGHGQHNPMAFLGVFPPPPPHFPFRAKKKKKKSPKALQKN